MNITVKKMTKLPDGGAICTVDMPKEVAQFLIGEGFLAVLKRSLDTSESYVSEQKLNESLMAQDIEHALNNLRVACGYAPKYKILEDGVVYFYTDEE
jgi:hypothetical protein